MLRREISDTFSNVLTDARSMARSAASVGGAAGFSTAIQETALHTINETRPGVESGFNIGASVFLGGVCGKAGAKVFG
jgi:hypothetical protein